MSIEIIQINKWNNTQQELLSFLKKTNYITGDDIREWISNCIVHFTEINVPQNIVAYFLTKMEYVTVRGKKRKEPTLVRPLGYYNHLDEDFYDEYYKERFIGPFGYIEDEGYIIKTDNRLSGQTGGHVKMTPILVAFKVAQNLINIFEDQNRIIPKILITELEKYNETKTTSFSLERIQNGFQIRDASMMLTSIITATDSVLKLIPELSKQEDLKPRIQTAHDRNDIYEKYLMNPQILWALNNSRIIRNHYIHQPAKSDVTTMYEVTSCTHLLNLLISSMLASGNLILTKE